MTAFELNNLIGLGALDKVRSSLKRLSLKERLPLLVELIPYVNSTPAHLKFFRDHFANEIGALIQAGMDLDRAERLYRLAKKEK